MIEKISSTPLLYFSVAVLEARKLKKMDITGASDPYVKIKLFDNKVSFKDVNYRHPIGGIFEMFLHNFAYLYLYSSLHHAGKTNWKEEEDECEILQFEPVLE